jgi:DNA-binding response OmpR family regulator
MDSIGVGHVLEGVRVLIVEDEPLISMVLEDYVDDLGGAVAATAGSLHAGLAAAERTDAGLAILDINLDGEMSYPVALALRARGVPFFFVTGYAHQAMPPELLDALVVDKPYTVATIGKAARHALHADAAASDRSSGQRAQRNA